MTGLNCGTPSRGARPYLRSGIDAAVAITGTAREGRIDVPLALAIIGPVLVIAIAPSLVPGLMPPTM